MTHTTNVFETSTWATLAEATDDAHAFITRGEKKGHYPTDVEVCKVNATTASGLIVPALKNRAVVCTYADGKSVVRGMNGLRHTATTSAQWRELIHAAVAAGARPTGSHAWDGKVIAQFDIGTGNGIKTNLIIGDSFDGTSNLVVGRLAIRAACANALSVLTRKHGADWAKIRHTSTLEDKINRLKTGIAELVKEGASMAALFEAASSVILTPTAAKVAFDKLFPLANKDASDAAKTKALAKRDDARTAAAMSINRVGNKSGNLATLWNAATYLVDRKADGTARTTHGSGGMVGSMLFGARGKRVNVVQSLVEVVMANGETHSMTVNDALEVGADAEQMGAGLLADMLNDLN